MFVFRVFFNDGMIADIEAHSCAVIGEGDLYFYDDVGEECGYFEVSRVKGYKRMEEVVEVEYFWEWVGRRIGEWWRERGTPVGFDMLVRTLEGIEGDFFKEWVTMLRDARTGREKREAMGEFFESLERYLKGVVEEMEELVGERPSPQPSPRGGEGDEA